MPSKSPELILTPHMLAAHVDSAASGSGSTLAPPPPSNSAAAGATSSGSSSATGKRRLSTVSSSSLSVPSPSAAATALSSQQLSPSLLAAASLHSQYLNSASASLGAHGIHGNGNGNGDEQASVDKVAESFCKDFVCCGRVLASLHDLLEHYETQHIRFVDPSSQSDVTALEQQQQQQQQQQHSHNLVFSSSEESSLHGSDGGMDSPREEPPRFQFQLLDEQGQSPPMSIHEYTAVSGNVYEQPQTAMYHYAQPPLSSSKRRRLQQQQQQHLPHDSMVEDSSSYTGGYQSTVSAFETTTIMRGMERLQQQHSDPELNTMTYYDPRAQANGLVASAQTSRQMLDTSGAHLAAQQQQLQHEYMMASMTVAPSSLMCDTPTGGSSMDGGSGSVTPTSSATYGCGLDEDTSVSGDYRRYILSVRKQERTLRESIGGGSASSMGGFGGESMKKRHQCLVPGCGKVYKNANGLKYHLTHNHSLSEKCMAENASRAIRHDPVEKPYVCQEPGCEKRYKNANGLKYHMIHHHGQV